MNHALILPLLLPLFFGSGLLIAHRASLPSSAGCPCSPPGR